MTRRSTVRITDKRLSAAFSLIEIMVAVAVLVILTILVGQLTNSATAITRHGTKHIDADTQARAVLDRIGFDIAQMIKRTDIDYYIKQPTGYNGHGNGHGYGHKLQTGQQGSDQCAFFTLVPGYYPAGYTSGQQGPISLVAYRVNSDSSRQSYLMLERMAKGLLWNGVDNSSNLNNANTLLPIVFLPQTISGMNRPWYAAVNNDATPKSQDDAYEVVGPQVFRFEYWYLLKNGNLTDVPWDTDARPAQTTIDTPSGIGLTDVQAIAVAIAVIDPTSRALLYDPAYTADPWHKLLDLASDLDDFKTAPGRGVGGAKKAGDLEYRWNIVLETVAQTGQTSANSKFPSPAASAIRVYCRYYDLRSQ
jgi:hypothetical protein